MLVNPNVRNALMTPECIIIYHPSAKYLEQDESCPCSLSLPQHLEFPACRLLYGLNDRNRLSLYLLLIGYRVQILQMKIVRYWIEYSVL